MCTDRRLVDGGCRRAGQAPARRDPRARQAGDAADPTAELLRDPEAPRAEDAVPGASRARADAGDADQARPRTIEAGDVIGAPGTGSDPRPTIDPPPGGAAMFRVSQRGEGIDDADNIEGAREIVGGRQ